MNVVQVQAGPPRHSIVEIQRAVVSYLTDTQVIRAVLFGSYARGDADFASDMDLVLIERTPRPFVERGLAHLPLFRLGVGVDLIVYTPEEYDRLVREGNSFVERLEREGIILYERPDG